MLKRERSFCCSLFAPWISVRGFLHLKMSFTLAISTSSESPLCLREWLNQLACKIAWLCGHLSLSWAWTDRKEKGHRRVPWVGR